MMISNTKFLAQKTLISTTAHVSSLSNGGAMSLKEQVPPPSTTSSVSTRPVCGPVFFFALDWRLPFSSSMTAEVFEVDVKPAVALGDRPRSKFDQLKPPENVARLSDP